MIPLLSFIFLHLLSLRLASSITQKPGCPDRCGNVSIPYPFGVGSDCFLEASFNITCNTSSNPSKPYLNINNQTIEVVDIKLDHPPQIRIVYPNPLSAACYNISSTGKDILKDRNSINLLGTQYTLSEDNWLTAVGCDDFVAAMTTVGNKSLSDACIGFCEDIDNSPAVDGGTCPSNVDGNSVGQCCCRSPIPKGTSVLYTNLVDMSESWNRSRLFPCSYAFVMEKGASTDSGFSYNFSVLQDYSEAFLQTANNRPVVLLDWRIGAQSCSQVQQNSSNFVCHEGNSHCVDFGADTGGYLCNCSEGYQGNPYQGCKDIDECVDDPCGPHSNCLNIPGSYQCKCRRGYTGDGKPSGSGCTPHDSNMIKFVIIGLSSALGLVLLYIIWLGLHKVLQKRNNRKHKEDLFKHLLFQKQTNEDMFMKTKLFSAKELEKATDNFNESRICGQGGQGIVYKGMLSDGTIAAIKKLRQVDENQVEQFINEVVILSQISHKNVVKLLGCCLATEVPLLVYEFLPNGTLFDLIRHPNLEFPFTWNMRLKIAADVAGAISYLHSASSEPIYHRDVKSTNVLLDEKNIVKVSDFGTSKFVQVDHTHLTTLVKGTFGYLDPEYFQTSQYTEKSDVYSFGVVLVELLTGQRPVSFDERSRVHRNLGTLFVETMEANNLDAILDSQVWELQASKEEVMAVAKLARRCLNFMGKMRPTMREVATVLESLRISQTPSLVNDESEEARVYEAKSMMFSDIGNTWTISDHSTAATSFDEHPLMST